MPTYNTLLSIGLWSMPAFLFITWCVKKRLANNYLLLLISAVLILLLSFRTEDIGVDTNNYFQSYYFETYLNTESYEWSWVVICTFFQRVLHADIFWVLFVYALITIAPVFYVSKKESVFPLLSILLYVVSFYIFSFNIMRHMAAVSMCLLCTYFLNNKKNVYAIISAIVAYLLHNTALFFIVVVFMYMVFRNKKISVNSAIVLLYVFLVVGYFLFGFFSYIISLSPIEKYRTYQDYAFSRNVNVDNIFIMNIVHTLWGSLVLFMKKNKTDNSWYYRLYIFSLFLDNLISYHIGADRLIYFFSITSIIFIPNLVVECVDGKTKKISPQAMQFVLVYILYLIAMYYYKLPNVGGGLDI